MREQMGGTWGGGDIMDLGEETQKIQPPFPTQTDCVSSEVE